jgi:hypothetical protein
LGLIVPKLITRKTTARLAGILYTFFGFRLMYIGWRSDPKLTAAAEFEEVEVRTNRTNRTNCAARVSCRRDAHPFVL